MQVLHSTTKRFLKGFWNLRQKLFKEIGGKLRNAYGVDLSHVQILRTISQQDVSPTQLGEVMQIPAHGISRALDYLETQNLLERSLHPADARKRTLTITPAGTTLLSQSDTLIESEMQSMLSVLSKKDLDLFLHYLETLNKE